MTEQRSRFTPRDDNFHFELMGDEWWATETSWFAFCKPERGGLGGWFYTMARPNIGTVAGGIWIWDDTAHLPWEALYSVNLSALKLPRDQDLSDIKLPSGVSIKMIEPCMSYALGYEDGDRAKVDLRFDGVMPPEPLSSAGSPFGSAHHFDQIGRVHGEIVLHGETIAIDCLGFRDRTWGKRPEDRPRQAAYVTGAAAPDHGFLAVTAPKEGIEAVAYGFLRRDGRTVPLARGERSFTRHPEHGWVTEIAIRGTDAEGRTLNAVGHPVSRIILNCHSFIDVNSLIRWDIDGEVGWGEDQDMHPVHTWSRARRERQAALAK